MNMPLTDSPIHWRIQGVQRERVHPVGLGQKQSNQPVLG